MSRTCASTEPTDAVPTPVSFVITSMPVGGAETLLVNLVTRFDRKRIQPEVICLKERGPLGEELSSTVPVHSQLLSSKWDVRILNRLVRHFRKHNTQAVVTVGAGDKMFWGRLAAKVARVPVILSALHSTGWPDGVGKLNRLLTPITDGFIAVAQNHAQFLVQWEGFPRERVFTIPNGVDVDRFRPRSEAPRELRDELGIPLNALVVGIVAALRAEKNHIQFVEAAFEVLRLFPQTHFVVVGDGPERPQIESRIQVLGLQRNFHLLGTRSDTERILAGFDVFALTSKNEANPVSILEAFSCGVPVVSTDVGSIRETVIEDQTGFLTEPGNAQQTAVAIGRLLSNTALARKMGVRGRENVSQHWSLRRMVEAYEQLILRIRAQKLGLTLPGAPAVANDSTLQDTLPLGCVPPVFAPCPMDPWTAVPIPTAAATAASRGS